MRIVSIVGARPQFIKLAPMAHAFAQLEVEHKIIHTGQHYDVDMSDAFFQDLQIPDPDLHLGVGSGSHGVQTGGILAALDPVFTGMAPDCVLVYGDTNSTLAGALAAVKLHIGLVHLEAGLRSFNRRMPEEHNRVLTDHAADLCLAPTEVAIQHLTREGLGERAVMVGDVMVDVCYQVRDMVAQDSQPIEGVADDEPFLLATIHRAENTDDPERLAAILEKLAHCAVPVVLAAHPRLRSRAAEFDVSLTAGKLRPVAPLAYPDMVRAVVRSKGVVTDSGGLQKEAFLLGVPCTTLRTETEWVETLDNGWNVLDPDLSRVNDEALRPVPAAERGAPYGNGHAAIAAAETIVSHWS